MKTHIPLPQATTFVSSAVYVSAALHVQYSQQAHDPLELQFTQARPGFLQAKLVVERGHVNKFMVSLLAREPLS